MKRVVLIREMQIEEITIHRIRIWYLQVGSEDE